jgi:aspartyl-tRNA(Asn)/glutamyl-tRNA(Gln) amidotransferase subunit A
MTGADPVVAVEACLARIAALNPAIHAFLTVDAAGARAAAAASAERWRRGAALSAVDGMPIGIKANIAVAGMPFHAGIGAYRDRIAVRDAECVARLRAGGAVLLGVLNMDEAALGASTDNPVFGRTENPRRAGYSAGGSSGGAGAAVAAGFCKAALGTDTLGSVRIPASYCGVVGCKPRHGGISLDGVVPLEASFDTVGVLASDVGAAGRVLGVMGVGGGGAVGSVGVLSMPGVEAAPAVAAALRKAACRVGAKGVTLPGIEPRAVRRASFLVMALGAVAEHGAAMSADPAGFSERLRGVMAWALAQDSETVAAAKALVRDSGAAIRERFAPFDAVLMPTTPSPAFAFADRPGRDQADFTALANISGLAAVALPVGADESGLPVSVQAVGASVWPCMAVAKAFEAFL